MAADIFAKIGDIKGESLDAKHKGEIEVLSWSWGVNNAGSMGVGSGGGTGKASFSDLTFQHEMDKASPVLMLACSTGKHYPEATFTARKSGGEQQEYLTVKLSDVIVTGVSVGHGNGSVPSESISLQFAKVELEYKPQKPDGSLDAGVQFKYNLNENKTY
jgi:type VI secretion system secreted protein Hcp